MSDPKSIYGELFADAECRTLFNDQATLQGMLDFEAALARGEADEGIIPAATVMPIVSACRAELYDIAEIGRQTTLAGNPAIPMVKLLTAKVAETDKAAARWVHWGATSQDAMDSGRLFQASAGLELIEARIAILSGTLAGLADKHRVSIMPGRTLLQHALPTTFGLKAAYWLDALLGHACALKNLRPMPRIQLGGAAGTLASLDDAGPGLRIRMSGTEAAAPWHTTRQVFGRLGAELGLISGTLGKIGCDIMLLMQTEVGEVREPAEAGKGGSSAMPHKRNPVQSLAMAAIAERTPGLVATMFSSLVQEHERAIGGWHAEWETLPQLFTLTSASLKHAIGLLGGLEVDTVRMRANLEMTQGLVLSERISLALAEKIGRLEAKAIIEEGCRATIAKQIHLRKVLGEDTRVTTHFDGAALDQLFDLATYLGASASTIDQVLHRYSSNSGSLPEN